MKIHALILLLPVFFIACVSNTKYKELEKENVILKEKVNELKYGDKVLYEAAKNAFNSDNFIKSKRYARTLIKEHPSSIYFTNTQDLIVRINRIEVNRWNEKEKIRKEVEKRLSKNIKEEYDGFKKITFYESTRYEYVHGAFGPSFQIKLYIGKRDNGEKYFRIKSILVSEESKRQSFYKVQLWGDNGTVIDYFPEYIEEEIIEERHGIYNYRSTVYKQLTADNPIDLNLVLDINKSNEMKFRFILNSSKNTETITHSFNENQRKAFNEIVEKFNRLK